VGVLGMRTNRAQDRKADDLWRRVGSMSDGELPSDARG